MVDISSEAVKAFVTRAETDGWDVPRDTDNALAMLTELAAERDQWKQDCITTGKFQNHNGKLFQEQRDRADALEAERDALKLKVERLIGAGETCAAELYAWVNDHYEKTADYPSEARRKARDMQPVIDLRTAIDEARK